MDKPHKSRRVAVSTGNQLLVPFQKNNIVFFKNEFTAKFAEDAKIF